MKKSKLFTVAIASLGIFTLLFAGCKPKTPEERADRIVKFIDNKLDLTEDQKKVLNKVKIDILAKKDEVKALRDEIRSEVKKQLLSDEIDTKYVKKHIQSKQAKIESLKFFMVDKFAEFHKVLTPEQKKELVEKLEKHSRRNR